MMPEHGRQNTPRLEEEEEREEDEGRKQSDDTLTPFEASWTRPKPTDKCHLTLEDG